MSDNIVHHPDCVMKDSAAHGEFCQTAEGQFLHWPGDESSGETFIGHCRQHKVVQHRDGKEPWCNSCGLTDDARQPKSRFDAKPVTDELLTSLPPELPELDPVKIWTPEHPIVEVRYQDEEGLELHFEATLPRAMARYYDADMMLTILSERLSQVLADIAFAKKVDDKINPLEDEATGDSGE